MTEKRETDTIITTYNELSIQVSLNGLSFCIYNPHTKNVVALEQHVFSDKQHPETITHKLREYFQENNALQEPFKKVFLIHNNALSTFVPEALFNDKNLSDYLKFNIKILENDFMAYDALKAHGLMNVYVPYVTVNNFIFEHFGAFEYNHFSTILVNTILSRVSEKKETCMFVHVQKEHFEIVVVKDQKLLLYNTFDYTTKEDFIYYILFTAEQLALDPEIFPLYLLGEVDNEDPLYTMAYTYVRNVFFGTPHGQLSVTAEEKAPETHKNIILLSSF